MILMALRICGFDGLENLRICDFGFENSRICGFDGFENLRICSFTSL